METIIPLILACGVCLRVSGVQLCAALFLFFGLYLILSDYFQSLLFYRRVSSGGRCVENVRMLGCQGSVFTLHLKLSATW